jgi:hypothetical protein
LVSPSPGTNATSWAPAGGFEARVGMQGGMYPSERCAMWHAASVAGPTRSRGFASLSTEINVAPGACLESAGWTWPHPPSLYSGNRISMPRSALARELSQAKEQVGKDPDRIAHQRAVVSRHEEGGLDSAIARAILDQLETLQRVHLADRDRLLAEAALENKPPGE